LREPSLPFNLRQIISRDLSPHEELKSPSAGVSKEELSPIYNRSILTTIFSDLRVIRTMYIIRDDVVETIPARG
jgi:hypothetical protein